jgi:hypothetical protein
LSFLPPRGLLLLLFSDTSFLAGCWFCISVNNTTKSRELRTIGGQSELTSMSNYVVERRPMHSCLYCIKKLLSIVVGAGKDVVANASLTITDSS